MRRLLHLLLLALSALTYAQIDTALILPPGNPPDGCQNSMVGAFNVNSGSGNSSWTVFPNATLTGSQFVTQNDFFVFIRSDYFIDTSNAPGSDAVYTGGWNICSNGTMTLGPQITFYLCLENGGWYLYERKINDTCQDAQLWVEPQGALYSTSLTIVSSTSQTAAASATSSQAPATVYVTATSTNSPTATAAASSGLSTGAEAGIGVGAGIAGSLAVLGLGFLLLRRRRANTDREKAHERDSFIQDAGADTGAMPVYQGANKAELPLTNVREHPQELSNTWIPHQDGYQGRGPVELEAQQRYGGGGPGQ